MKEKEKLQQNTLTIYDISEKAGVSIATVSRVLNGSRKVSPATKKKFWKLLRPEDTNRMFSQGDLEPEP